MVVITEKRRRWKDIPGIREEGRQGFHTWRVRERARERESW